MNKHIIAAKLCHLSYVPQKTESFVLRDLSNKQTDVEAYSMDLGEKRFIVVRGSSSLKDWWRNFQVKLLDTPYKEKGYQGGVKIHKGFYSGYLSIKENVLKLAETDLDLVVCGHSQGGSIASIAAVDINFSKDKDVELVTFGTPAVGNKEWQESANKRIKSYNYRNKYDIVPYLLYKNYHIGKIIKLDRFNLNPHYTKNYSGNTKRHILKEQES